MNGLAIDLTQYAHLGLMLVGLGLLYVASRAAVDALVPAGEGWPGWRAVGHQMPIAGVAVAGVLLGEAGLAIGVLFGASVASLALGCGAVAAAAERRIEAGAEERRVWPFVVVVAVLTMMAGFAGEFKWGHAAAFAVEGVVVGLLWREGKGGEVGKGEVGKGIRGWFLALAVLLVVVGAWATARGAVEVSRSVRPIALGTLAAAMIGPMLVLPMLGTGTALAARDLGGVVVTTQVGVVLLNLCLWLPVVIVAGHVQGMRGVEVAEGQSTPASQPTTMTTTEPSTQPGGEEETIALRSRVPFPMVVWRVDTVVLLVLGLVLLPAAVGRWGVGRRDGVVMLFVYVGYLMVVAAMGRR